MKHFKWIIVAALFLLGCLPACRAKNGPLTITARGGVLDLRSVNLTERSVPLNGEWQFYWRRLLQPGDSITTAPDLVAFPSLWNKIKLHGQPLPVEGYATYSLTILLPKNRPPMTLLMTHVYCSYR